MDDLVERLRDAAALPTGLYAEAADEIERLRQVCRDAYEVWAGSEGIPEPVALVGELCDTSRADALRRGYSVGQYLFTHPAPTPDETAKLREQLAAVTREFEFQFNAHLQAQELLLEQGQQLAAVTRERDWLHHKSESLNMERQSQDAQLAATQAEVEALRKDAETAWAQAHRLALELECFLLSCKDMPTVSKWWDSAHEALEEHRKLSAMQPAADEAGKGK